MNSPRRGNLHIGPYQTGPNDTPLNGVYQGDCLQLMSRMPSECVDMIVTSPPYNVGLKYVEYDDDLPHEEFVEFNRRWLAEAFRVAMPGTRMYVVIGDRMDPWYRELTESVGWQYVQPLYYLKRNMAGCNKRKIDWAFLSEAILLFRKGKTPPMLKVRGISTHNWFAEVTPQSDYNGTQTRVHPAQWPVSLTDKLIRRTPGDVVFDPFVGSGTALMSAKSDGRRYLGFELVEEYAQLARDRVRMAERVTQLELMGG